MARVQLCWSESKSPDNFGLWATSSVVRILLEDKRDTSTSSTQSINQVFSLEKRT